MEPFYGDILDASRLCFNGNFEAQVYHILQVVRLSRGDVENLQMLLDDLQYAFNTHWPGSVVQPFGSTVTGLGIKTSDVDCFVLLPNYVEITSDIVFIAKDLLRQYRVFGDFLTIANARVPIVKFLHYPTNSYCDVNFKSPFGVRNSNLIASFLNLDRKVLEFAVLIKYWSKVHKLTGTNLLSNYALTLLVIFYLQQKNIFPSVYELQNNISSNFVDHWNTAFESPKLTTTMNTKSLYDIMGGFFKYYSMFDFNEQIVSPFLGRPLKKTTFKGLNNVPEEFSTYKYNVFNKISQSLKINTIMCIQDPFEHNRNCSSAVHPKLMKAILLYISFGAKKYEEEQNQFLKAILTERPNQHSQPESAPSSSSNPGSNKSDNSIPKHNTLRRVVKKKKMKGKYNLTICYQQMQKKMQHGRHHN